jgi:hypothetical protein
MKPHTSSSQQQLGELKVSVEYGFDGEAVEISGVLIGGSHVWADNFADDLIKRWEDAIALELREEDAAVCEQADMYYDAREAA